MCMKLNMVLRCKIKTMKASNTQNRSIRRIRMLIPHVLIRKIQDCFNNVRDIGTYT